MGIALRAGTRPIQARHSRERAIAGEQLIQFDERIHCGLRSHSRSPFIPVGVKYRLRCSARLSSGRGPFQARNRATLNESGAIHAGIPFACRSSSGQDLDTNRLRPADRHVENVAGGQVVPRSDCSSTGRSVRRLVCQRPPAGTSRLRRLRRCAGLVRATADAELGRGLAFG